MISLYSTAFNIQIGQFESYLDNALSNWFSYVDEVVIATIKDNKDNTLSILESKKDKWGDKLKIVIADIDLTKPGWDGKIKDAALQNCFNNNVIQQDLDELLIGKKEDWEQIFVQLDAANKQYGVMALMMPTMNLFGDINHYSEINQKWYCHIKSGLKRGPIKEAINQDGTINIEKSDSCEIIDNEGRLPKYGAIYMKCKDEDYLDYFKQGAPFSCHWGFLDLKRRLEVINPIWKPLWSVHAGKEVKLPTTIEELNKKPKEHGLDLSKYFNT